MIKADDQPTDALAAPLSTQVHGSEGKSLAAAWLALLLPVIFIGFFSGWAHMPLFFLKPGTPNPITIVFGIVALSFLARALWELVRYLRFGNPTLALAQVPVPVGGTLQGRITLSSRFPQASPFNVQLQCIRRVLQQGGKNSRYVETVFWTGTQSSSSLLGGIVPISIDLPLDQPTTDSSNPL